MASWFHQPSTFATFATDRPCRQAMSIASRSCWTYSRRRRSVAVVGSWGRDVFSRISMENSVDTMIWMIWMIEWLTHVFFFLFRIGMDGWFGWVNVSVLKVILDDWMIQEQRLDLWPANFLVLLANALRRVTGFSGFWWILMDFDGFCWWNTGYSEAWRPARGGQCVMSGGDQQKQAKRRSQGGTCGSQRSLLAKTIIAWKLVKIHCWYSQCFIKGRMLLVVAALSLSWLPGVIQTVERLWQTKHACARRKSTIPSQQHQKSDTQQTLLRLFPDCNDRSQIDFLSNAHSNGTFQTSAFGQFGMEPGTHHFGSVDLVPVAASWLKELMPSL